MADNPGMSLQRGLSHEPGEGARKWVIPYIDQPLEFWQEVRQRFGHLILEVYCALPELNIGTAHPVQPSRFLEAFLRAGLFDVSALVNPIALPRPVEVVAPEVVAALQRVRAECRLTDVTVSNLQLAAAIRTKLPQLRITASTLMEISLPSQVVALQGIVDTLVPATRIMRDIAALRALRQAFSGRVRLMLNEACIPGCPMRVQHFVELNRGGGRPKSLCQDLLARSPWLRLTGAWVLPQHLHLYAGLYDELKLAGRVTLRQAERYLEVLQAYLQNGQLTPDRIGGGPASVLHPIPISEDFFKFTLYCGGRCGQCQVCRNYYEQALRALGEASTRISGPAEVASAISP